MQGTARPGAASVTTVYPYNASNIFTITVYLSNGLTSRGRIGIDNAMYMGITTPPWFQDSADKTTLLAGINNLLSTVSQGMYCLPSSRQARANSFALRSPQSHIDHTRQHYDHHRLRQQLPHLDAQLQPLDRLYQDWDQLVEQRC